MRCLALINNFKKDPVLKTGLIRIDKFLQNLDSH